MDDVWSQSVAMAHVKEMGFPLQYYKSIVCAVGFNGSMFNGLNSISIVWGGGSLWVVSLSSVTSHYCIYVSYVRTITKLANPFFSKKKRYCMCYVQYPSSPHNFFTFCLLIFILMVDIKMFNTFFSTKMLNFNFIHSTIFFFFFLLFNFLHYVNIQEGYRIF